MKRLIIKTATITLAVILGIVALTIGGLCLFAPSTMGDLCQKTGNYAGAVAFARREYDKSGEIGSLQKVVYRADLARDYGVLEEACAEMIKREDFDAHCAAIDLENEKNNNKGWGSHRNYVYSVYAEALYRNGKKPTALSVAAAEAEKSGYTERNPVRSLISCALEDADFLEEILARLEGMIVETGWNELQKDIAFLKEV